MALLCASLSVASTCLPIRRVTTSSSHQLDDIRRRVAADDRLKRPCPSIERPALLCRPIVALVDPDNPGPTSGYMVQDGLGHFEADSKPLQIGRERPAAVAKSSPALLGDRRRGPRLPPASARRSNHRSSPSAVVYLFDLDYDLAQHLILDSVDALLLTGHVPTPDWREVAHAPFGLATLHRRKPRSCAGVNRRRECGSL
jgi:hypothetical protein